MKHDKNPDDTFQEESVCRGMEIKRKRKQHRDSLAVRKNRTFSNLTGRMKSAEILI